MRIRPHQKQDNKNRSATSEATPNQEDTTPALQFVDNRPANNAQRKLQTTADNSNPALAGARETLLQGKFAAGATALQKESDSGSTGNSTSMPNQLKTGLERLSGIDLSDVRVNFNSSKPAQLNALAYAQGNEIHVASGQEKHLPHEAWHVVQQKQGRVKPTKQLKAVKINDDAELEAEATEMGEKALHEGGRPAAESGADQARVTAAPSGGPAPLQGKFGLEVELPILASAKSDTSNKILEAEHAMTDSVKLADGDGFRVHVDHKKSMKPHHSIIELVTYKPIDEFAMSKTEAANQTRKMAATATSMAGRATNSPPKKLSAVTNINTVHKKDGWDLYAGHPQGEGQSDRGYVQITFGIQLGSVPDAMRRAAKTDIREKDQDSIRFTGSATGADRLVEEIRQKMNLPKETEDPALAKSLPSSLNPELDIDLVPPVDTEQDLEAPEQELEAREPETAPSSASAAPPPPPMDPSLGAVEDKVKPTAAPNRAPDALNIDLSAMSGNQSFLRSTNYKYILRQLSSYRKNLARGKASSTAGRLELMQIATNIRDHCQTYVKAHENDTARNKDLGSYQKKVPKKKKTRVFWIRRLEQQADSAITRLGNTEAGAGAIQSSKEDVESLQPLAGLFAFLLNYLIAGQQKMKSNNLLKNAVGQFYAKASLASIAAGMSGAAAAVLMDKTWRKFVKKRLLELSDRKAGEAMFPQKHKGKALMPLSCEKYLESVLSGRADPLYAGSVNPWSPELKDKIGPQGEEQEALVIENRRATPAKQKTMLDDIRERGGETGKGMAPKQWVELTEKYYDLLHEIHKTQGS